MTLNQNRRRFLRNAAGLLVPAAGLLVPFQLKAAALVVRGPIVHAAAGGGGPVVFGKSDADARTYPSGTSGTNAWSVSPVSGRCIIVAVSWKLDVTVTSVTDSQGNTYVDCGAGRLARPTDGFLQLFGATNIIGGANTCTVNFSSSADEIVIDLLEYSGQNTSSLWDSATATGTATSGTSVTSGNLTPAVTNGAVIGFTNSNDTDCTAGTNFTVRISGDGMGEEDRIFTSSVGTITATVNFSVEITKAAIIAATIKAA